MQVVDLLRQFTPHGRSQTLTDLAANWGKVVAAGITTPLRVAHFLAQVATETGEFSIIEENMNYSAERLCQVWPSHFRSLGVAAAYAHNPEKLANYIYADANRKPGYRLGNTQPGDGWRYRGRGLMQTTGRDNYRRAGHEANPEALAIVGVSLDAALQEWTEGGCNALADADNLKAIRRVINGGQIGIEHAAVHLARAKRIFTAGALADLRYGGPPSPTPAKPAPRPQNAPPAPAPPPTGGMKPATPKGPAVASSAAGASGGVIAIGAQKMGIDPGIALAVGFLAAVAIFVIVNKFRKG